MIERGTGQPLPETGYSLTSRSSITFRAIPGVCDVRMRCDARHHPRGVGAPRLMLSNARGSRATDARSAEDKAAEVIAVARLRPPGAPKNPHWALLIQRHYPVAAKPRSTLATRL